MVLSMQPDILLTPRGLIPVVSNGGNEESDKKKTTKIESGSFWEINLIGGQI